MTIVMTKLSQFAPSAPAETDFSQTVSQIIEMAHRYIGEYGVVYEDMSKNLLNVITLNLQGRGYYFWNNEDVNKSFSQPSRVNGDGDGKIYTSYLGHTSASSNRPPTGANWRRYWFEDVSATTVSDWVVDTDYSSTGDFYPDADTLSIDNARIIYSGEDYPVEIISNYRYNELSKKYDTGRPRYLFFDCKPTPRVFLYPQVGYDEVDDYLLVYNRVVKLSNLEGTSEMDADFKSVWLLPLAQLLAKELAAQRQNISLERLLYLERKAAESVDNARKHVGIKAIRRK